MKIVYTIGPIRSPLGMDAIFENCMRARRIARELWLMGYAVICPQVNSLFMDGHDLGHDEFIAGDLAILERCDAVVLLPGWSESVGCREEKAHAHKHGIPVYYFEKDRATLGTWATT